MSDVKDEYGYGTYRVDYQKEQQENLSKQTEFNHDEAWGAKPRGYWTNRELERKSKDRNTPTRGGRKGGKRGFAIAELCLLLIILGIGIIAFQHYFISITENSAVLNNWGLTRNFIQNWMDLFGKVVMPVIAIIGLIALIRKLFFLKGTIYIIIAGITVFFGTAIYLVLSGVFFGK